MSEDLLSGKSVSLYTSSTESKAATNDGVFVLVLVYS